MVHHASLKIVEGLPDSANPHYDVWGFQVHNHPLASPTPSVSCHIANALTTKFILFETQNPTSIFANKQAYVWSPPPQTAVILYNILTHSTTTYLNSHDDARASWDMDWLIDLAAETFESKIVILTHDNNSQPLHDRPPTPGRAKHRHQRERTEGKGRKEQS